MLHTTHCTLHSVLHTFQQHKCVTHLGVCYTRVLHSVFFCCVECSFRHDGKRCYDTDVENVDQQRYRSGLDCDSAAVRRRAAVVSRRLLSLSLSPLAGLSRVRCLLGWRPTRISEGHARASTRCARLCTHQDVCHLAGAWPRGSVAAARRRSPPSPRSTASQSASCLKPATPRAYPRSGSSASALTSSKRAVMAAKAPEAAPTG